MMSDFETTAAWRRTPSVVLRPEPFGALVYDFTSRRLSFLKDLALVRVVEALDASASAEDALASAEIPDADRPRYRRALATLADAGTITRRWEAAS